MKVSDLHVGTFVVHHPDNEWGGICVKIEKVNCGILVWLKIAWDLPPYLWYEHGLAPFTIYGGTEITYMEPL